MMTCNPIRTGLIALCALTAFNPWLLPAQTFNGAISGAVVDSSNAAIANVTVQAVHKDTGIAFHTVSGKFGDFLFPKLIANTRNGAAAPGIGFGEPRNVQLALKLI